MNFRCSSAPLADLGCDGLAIGLFSNNWKQQLAELLSTRANAVQALLELRHFKGKRGEHVNLTLPGGEPALLLVTGLGEPEHFDTQGLRQAAASLAQSSRGWQF